MPDRIIRGETAGGSEEVAVVTISRNSAEDIHQRQVIVKLDGRERGDLLFGDSLTFKVLPGRHKLQVDNTWNKKTVEFEVAAGDHLRFRAVNRTGHWGWFLLSALGVGLIWVSLEREAESSN